MLGPVSSVCLAGSFPHRVPHSLEGEGGRSECGCAAGLQVEPSSPQGAGGERGCWAEGLSSAWTSGTNDLQEGQGSMAGWWCLTFRAVSRLEAGSTADGDCSPCSKGCLTQNVISAAFSSGCVLISHVWKPGWWPSQNPQPLVNSD